MTMSIRNSLTLLCSNFGISIRDLTDDQCQSLAEVLISTPQTAPTKRQIERLVASVRADGAGVAQSAERVVDVQGGEVAGSRPAPGPSAPGTEGTKERGLVATGQAAELTPYSSAPSVPRKPRYLATERTTRQRLATTHRIEDARSGLYIVPKRPKRMAPGAVHPPCKAAFQDGGTPCVLCTPLLHSGTCECDICDEWWEQVDG